MFILLDKAKDISSFNFISKFARENKIKKIGHTGTLDPLATGLLLVATNDYTKLIEYLKNEDKKYVVEMMFGISTNTLDITGLVLERNKKTILQDDFEKALKNFEKSYLQLPPIFSAKKVNGKRAYNLARNNVDFHLKHQKVSIFKNKLISYNFPFVRFETHVSKGTYVRSLVYDLARFCNSIACMTNLDRVSIGELDRSFINKEIDIKSLINLDIKYVELDDVKLIKYGRQIKIMKKETILICYKNFPICISENFKPKKVFAKTIERILNKNESN